MKNKKLTEFKVRTHSAKKIKINKAIKLLCYACAGFAFTFLGIITLINDNDNSREENTIDNYFFHYSFDDVSICFTNLSNNSYESLFDEPFFNKLQELHNNYNAKFSLYTYTDILTSVPVTFANDFSNASSWLKIGYHSYKNGVSNANLTYDDAKSYWNDFVFNVKRITGSESCIDRYPRLEYFAGYLSALQGFRDAECGALGFLSSDDTRLSYYFNSAQMQMLYSSGEYWIDTSNDLTFIRTDFRCDWLQSSFTDNYSYKKPVKSNVYDELNYRFNSGKYNNLKYYIIFTHEWCLYDGNTISSNIQWVEDTCYFVKDFGYKFDFAQNYNFQICFQIVQFIRATIKINKKII